MNQKITIIMIIVVIIQFTGMSQNLLSQVPEQDSLALVALYDSTDGPNWTTNTNWLTGPVSEWYGITVIGGRVTEVFLPSNNLSGTIPPEIGNLTNLTTLHLSDNLLTGPIPAEIENLENLVTLHLRFNQLSGPIPIGMYNLTTLTLINLSVNQLEGTIPIQIGNLVNLTEYSVPANNMYGTIPDEIGNLVNLKHLWLNLNEFEGAVPDGVGQMPELLILRLNNNQFTDLPDISANTLLTNTQVQNNRFTFEDIEPNVSVGGFIYSPQDSIGDGQDIIIPEDSSYVMSVSVDGTANHYQWTKDGVEIEDAADNSYVIFAANATDEGVYFCHITNTIGTDLTLYSRAINVTVSGAVGIEDQLTDVPKTFILHQNYPNPFNPRTIISYQLPIQSHVELAIYNMAGQIVTSLVSAQQSAGSYQYEWKADELASGNYFYRLTTSSGFVQTRKMVVLK